MRSLPVSLSLLAMSWRRAALVVAALALPFAGLGAARIAAEEPSGQPPPTRLFEAGELDSLVAPVALYPDVLLDSLLPATIFSADLTSAAAFVSARGGTVEAAPADVTWDANVVALLQFPDVLLWIGENPTWVESVGFAVTMQQDDVLAAIQRYRVKARDAGVLTTNSYLIVTIVAETQYVVIQPVSPSVVYVPVYDPWLLDGSYHYAPSRPFFTSWFGFQFGTTGLWARNRIVWGFGIYDYGSPWWWGSWRNQAADWGTYRPTRWYAGSTSGERYSRSGFDVTAASRVRVTSPRYSTAGVTSRSVGVVPSNRLYQRPDGRDDERTRASSRQLRDPAVPVAPRTWVPRTSTPRVVAPTPIPREQQPMATPRVQRSPAPPLAAPAPTVVPRGTARLWSARGRGSLDGGAQATPSDVAPRAQSSTPRAQPAAPRAHPATSRAHPATPWARPDASRAQPRVESATPQARMIPRRRPLDEPIPSGERMRKARERGASSLRVWE